MKVTVISGKSGVGKDTVIKYLMKYHHFKRFPSLTTRPMREGEKDGFHYHFVTREYFEQQLVLGKLLDWVTISGYYYGFPIDDFMKNEKGIWVFNLVAESGLALKRLLPQAFLVYLVFPNKETQIERLKMRGMSDYEIGIRLRDDPNGDRKPFYYNYEIKNFDSVETAWTIARIVGGKDVETSRRRTGQQGDVHSRTPYAKSL